MTRNELLKKWCDAEGGKVSALNAPQSREAYAKLRRIIGETFGVDIDDVIRNRETGKIYTGHSAWIAYRYLPLSPDGKHLLPKRARKMKAKAKRGGK